MSSNSALKIAKKSSDSLHYELPEDSKILSEDFTIGTATASYQIEGSPEADGKLESIWDRFSNTPGKVKNGDTGLFACDHFNRRDEDLKMIKDLGFEAYRFSVSWPRVMDRNGKINRKGMDFYKGIVDQLNEYSIKPFLTLYHWDLPQYIEDRGGWLNRDCAYRFEEYADLVSSELGESVYSYATLNEPWVSAFLGYGWGVHAPGVKGDRNAKQASHHLLLAHGLGMRALRKNSPKSKNGIVLNMGPMTPLTDSYDDKIACLIGEAGGTHWFLEPLMKGRYPHIINRLKPEEAPLVLDGDLELISAPLDFLGINYYTRNIAAYDSESLLKIHRNDEAEHTDFDWEIYPQGLTDLLTDINRQYDLPEIMITENGASGNGVHENDIVVDEQRCRYYNMHLNAVDKAVRQGVNVTGYFAWSLMDNFEWAEGYTKRFGIVHVDYETQKRTLKSSALSFKDLMMRKNPK